MNGSVTTGRPTSAVMKERGVINIADEKLAAHNRTLHLSVTPKAEIHVALHEHLRIDGTVGAVANSASLAQRRMLKDMRPGFFTMTSGAILVQAGHRKAAFRLHNIHAVGIVTLDTIHLAFQYGVMLRKVKLRAGFLMALEAGVGIFARVDDEFFEAATARHGDVLACRTVTGLTAVLAGHGGILQSQPRVGTGRKNAADIRMAIHAGLVPDVGGSFDLQRNRY
jgi:hypothetical protein